MTNIKDDSPDPENMDELMQGKLLEIDENHRAWYTPTKEGDIFFRFTCYDAFDDIVDNIMVYYYVNES